MSSVAAEALSFSSSLQDKKKGLLHEYHKVKGDTEEVEREKDFSDKLSDFFGLNTTQKLIVAAICIAISIVFGTLAVIFVTIPGTFAITYTLCVLFFLLGTMFVVGPKRQLKKMFKPHRFIACCVFLASIVLTLWAGLYLKNLFLVLIFLIIQLAATIWYIASFIPMAQDAIYSSLESAVA